jgi:hypothetical protein
MCTDAQAVRALLSRALQLLPDLDGFVEDEGAAPAPVVLKSTKDYNHGVEVSCTYH